MSKPSSKQQQAKAKRSASGAKAKSEQAKKADAAKQPEVKTGRPTDYDPDYARQAAQLCILGATDEEIASFFGVSVRTIYRWKLQHEPFCQALQNGKNLPDERVARSLYQRALGTYVVEEQAVKVKVGPNEEKVEIVKVEKFVPPDTTAMIFWLKNRRSKEWKDVKHNEVGGPGDFANMTDEEIVTELERLAEAEIANLHDGNGSVN